MIDVLVLCSQYPTLDDYSRGQFFHVRNKYYQKNGCNIDVLNFETNQDYVIEGINVYTEEQISQSNKRYDIVLCHAPKLQQHFKYLDKNNNYRKIVFVFHGNEVLDTYKIAPYRYSYLPSSKFVNKLQRQVKDKVKLFLLRRQFLKYSEISHFVFVSNWMKKRMLASVGISEQKIAEHFSIINNAVGATFQNIHYENKGKKQYDFVCIRAQLDGAKYGVDIVCEIAKQNPAATFLIIGKGDYFVYNSIPENVEYLNKTLTHNEMINYLNNSRCALLPTRWDSQGLLTCEVATFGMPTITSDIPICHEMLDDFNNVGYIDNTNTSNTNIINILNDLELRTQEKKNQKFFAENTMCKEVELFRKMMQS